MKKLLLLCALFVCAVFVGGCGEERAAEVTGAQIVYGSQDYDQINPLWNEYGEIGGVVGVRSRYLYLCVSSAP